VDFHHIRKIIQASTSETAVMGATFFSALFIGLEFAIFLGVFLSLLLYLRRTSRPRVRVRAPDPRLPRRKFNTDSALPECPQVKLVRIDGSLFYGAVSHVSEQLRNMEHENPEQKHLVVIATGINFIDVAGSEMLAQEAVQRRNHGGGLYLLRPKAAALEVIKRGGYLKEIGEENLFSSKEAVIESVFQRLDNSVCRRCPRAVFRECPSAAQRDVPITITAPAKLGTDNNPKPRTAAMPG
jgi:SulP family sulfate permease